jgi:methionine synthase II (cobalamin-independent)
MAHYRADHVGSFLRTPELLEARRNASQDPARLRALEDQNILRVLAKQKELGFEICTDGELRRRNFMSDFTDAVQGHVFAMYGAHQGRQSLRTEFLAPGIDYDRDGKPASFWRVRGSASLHEKSLVLTAVNAGYRIRSRRKWSCTRRKS